MLLIRKELTQSCVSFPLSKTSKKSKICYIFGFLSFQERTGTSSPLSRQGEVNRASAFPPLKLLKKLKILYSNINFLSFHKTHPLYKRYFSARSSVSWSNCSKTKILYKLYELYKLVCLQIQNKMNNFTN